MAKHKQNSRPSRVNIKSQNQDEENNNVLLVFAPFSEYIIETKSSWRKRSIRLTSNLKDGSVCRIKLKDAERLVFGPFLEAAVKLEIHNGRSQQTLAMRNLLQPAFTRRHGKAQHYTIHNGADTVENRPSALSNSRIVSSSNPPLPCNFGIYKKQKIVFLLWATQFLPRSHVSLPAVCESAVLSILSSGLVASRSITLR